MRPARRVRVGALCFVLLALVLGVAACRGDTEPASQATRTYVGGSPAPADATVAPTETPEPVMLSPGVLSSYRYAIELSVEDGSLDDATGVPGAAGQRPANEDAGADTAGADLAGADFTIMVDGEVVNPDREHSQTRASLGFIELALERIQVGDRAWTREAGGDWKTATPGSASPAIGGDLEISPARIFAEGGSAFTALNRELRMLEFTVDEVNGVAARRYELSAEQFRTVFGGAPGLLPGDSGPLETRGTLWVAEGLRVPVRIQLTSINPQGAPAFEMDLSLRDLNDPITIVPPL